MVKFWDNIDKKTQLFFNIFRTYSMISKLSRILVLVVLVSLVLITVAQTGQPDIAFTINAFEKALPEGWSVAERTLGEIPYGHHYCDDYAGPKGTKVVVVGPKSVHVVWTSLSGQIINSPIAMESLELWFMPPEYQDSRMAWFCLHRPIQPVAILQNSSVLVFGRPSHRLNSKTSLSELLTKASIISWPKSPANDRSQISWASWEKDTRLSVQNSLPK